MSTKKKHAIDETLSDLYIHAVEFNDKLAVAKLLVTLECARLKQADDVGDSVPVGLQD